MTRNNFLEVIGFTRILNHNSHEIHRPKHATAHCKIDKIQDGGYATAFWAWFLIKKDKLLKRKKPYNGCAHCFKKRDTTGKKQ